MYYRKDYVLACGSEYTVQVGGVSTLLCHPSSFGGAVSLEMF